MTIVLTFWYSLRSLFLRWDTTHLSVLVTFVLLNQSLATRILLGTFVVLTLLSMRQRIIELPFFLRMEKDGSSAFLDAATVSDALIEELNKKLHHLTDAEIEDLKNYININIKR